MMQATLKNLVLTASGELKKQNLKLTTAESCTGGGLSYWITSVPGSSNWFDRSFVTYSNEAKIEMLDISPALLTTHGAVSAEVARAMAEHALQKSHAHISIAITGIAGPDGGSTQKPVGTVWFAWAKHSMMTEVEMKIFSGDRQAIRLQAMENALEKLLIILKN